VGLAIYLLKVFYSSHW